MNGAVVCVGRLREKYWAAAADEYVKRISRFGRLEIRPDSSKVCADGREVPLTPKEYDLLYFLARTPNVVKSREQILHAVWNTDYYGDGRTVDTHIKNLRMKLGDCGELVRTIRSRGYMLESVS